jgi:hypothetical protein
VSGGRGRPPSRERGRLARVAVRICESDEGSDGCARTHGRDGSGLEAGVRRARAPAVPGAPWSNVPRRATAARLTL